MADLVRLERAAAPPAAPADAAAQAEASAAARLWLEDVAPRRSAEAATLALLSAARALAEDAGAQLTDIAPIPPEARALDAFAPPQGAGVAVDAVEARVIGDHAALAALLAAPTPPGARIVALDIVAATPAPLREKNRLRARIVLAALRRPPEATQ
jgi:hypothetical protein